MQDMVFGGVPEISVAMSVYNMASGGILESAIDSIRRQTYQDWELIICDDGSTDGTWRQLKGMACTDPRIRLIRNAKNHGAGHARNRCIRAARGRYLAVMDADDISAPDRLKKQHAYLQRHAGAAFVGSRGRFFVQNVGDDDELYWYCENPKDRDYLFSLPYVHASIMFRREALARVHGYDASRRAFRAEDYDLLLRMCAAGQYGHNLKDVLYYIRRDKKQYQRRKYRYRFHEAYVKYRGFKELGLFPAGVAYAIKPLLVGLLPVRLTAFMQKRYYRWKNGRKGGI